jgi:hypothetical protein
MPIREAVGQYGANSGNEEAAGHAGLGGEEIGALGVEQQVAALLPPITLKQNNI